MGDLQQSFLALNGRYVNKFQANLWHLKARYPQPSGEVSAAEDGFLENLFLRASQCKLKAIAFMKLNLDVKFIRQCGCLLLYSMSFQ
jgi:hypothetical protein